MKFTFATMIKLITLTLLLALVAGCSGSSDAGKGGVTAQLQWPSAKTTAKSVALAPAGVATVRFVVSGPSMTTMQQDFIASAGAGTMPGIPVGSGITFTAQGLDSNNNLIYQGSKFGLGVTAGQVTNAGTIVMTSTSGAFVSAAGDYPNNHNEKLSVDANGNVVGINLTSNATVFTGTLISTTDATVFGFAGKFVADGVTLSGTLNTTTGVFSGTTSTNASWTATKAVPAYSNATLSGAWLMLSGGNGNNIYVIGDGNGVLSGAGFFNSATPAGSYSVQANGAYTMSAGVIPFFGSLTSSTAGSISYTNGGVTITNSLVKVANLAACQGMWNGTVTETSTHAISLTVDSTGTITAATGFTAPVAGKMFCESGNVVAFFKTGATDAFNQVNITGTLSGSSITGTVYNNSGMASVGTVSLTKAVDYLAAAGTYDYVGSDGITTRLTIDSVGNAAGIKTSGTGGNSPFPGTITVGATAGTFDVTFIPAPGVAISGTLNTATGTMSGVWADTSLSGTWTATKSTTAPVGNITYDVLSGAGHYILDSDTVYDHLYLSYNGTTLVEEKSTLSAGVWGAAVPNDPATSANGAVITSWNADGSASMGSTTGSYTSTNVSGQTIPGFTATFPSGSKSYTNNMGASVYYNRTAFNALLSAKGLPAVR